MATTTPPDNPSPPREQDKAGVVLSGVTVVVLLVGVLAIRSIRSDHVGPPTPQEPTPEEVETVEATADPKPDVVIAWPSNRTKNR